MPRLTLLISERRHRLQHVIETPGVRALHEAERIALLLAERRFDSFDGGNDPHNEHDFGAVAVGELRCFWKIDAYDRDLRAQSL